ncbi:transposase [Nonomuraea fuscirosea]|uniref:transposase n=1 Tax=Nonomuraea fuscirosea TaxID=1291556 RepID=UPI003F4CB54B
MKNYPPEFKADAVALVLSRPDRTITSMARDLGVSRERLRVWVRAAQARGEGGQRAAGGAKTGKDTPAGHLPSNDVLEEENKQLKARIRELKQRAGHSAQGGQVFRRGDVRREALMVRTKVEDLHGPSCRGRVGKLRAAWSG